MGTCQGEALMFLVAAKRQLAKALEVLLGGLVPDEGLWTSVPGCHLGLDAGSSVVMWE